MRFLHLGDLHIGKRVNEFPMIADQRFALDALARMAAEHAVDAVLIAGDFYDKPVPSEQAVMLAGSFLEELHRAGIAVLIVPGNHDSAERLSFLSGVIGDDGIRIARPYGGKVERVMFSDKAGDVAVHLLPYVTPSDVRRCHPESGARTFDEAVRAVVEHMDIDAGIRNVLVAHQLVLGSSQPLRSDSEQASIGGLDEVSADALSPFDYVALGHLHSPQWVVPGRIRYCGSPLKYSFSEAGRDKTASIVELDGGRRVELEELPVPMLHDMAEARGTLAEVRELACEQPGLADCYMKVVLTEPVEDAKAKLQDLFPLLMRVEFDYAGQDGKADTAQRPADIEELEPGDVFAELFEKMHGRVMDDEERHALEDVLAKVGEGGAR